MDQRPSVHRAGFVQDPLGIHDRWLRQGGTVAHCSTLEQSSDASDEWKASAHSLLAYAIAARDASTTAQRHVDDLAGAGPQALQTLVDGLDRLCRTAQPSLRRNLATLELHTIEIMGRQSPEASDADRRALAIARAHALAAAGRQEESVAEMRKLAEENPARRTPASSAGPGAVGSQRSGGTGRLAEYRTQIALGSDRWLRAKLYEARIYERQGDKPRGPRP